MFYPIELDKTRNLRYGMKALSLVEKKFKKPISKMDIDNLTMEETAVLIWAGLAHEDKNLTPERVMNLVDEYSNLSMIIEAVGEALAAAFGVNINETEEAERKNE